MRTRSSSNPVGESSSNPTSLHPKRRNRKRSKQSFILEEFVDTMADQRTMAKWLRAPTEGHAEAIVVPPILAEHFELKHNLITMMTPDQFFRLEKDNPHDHIRWFNKITSIIKLIVSQVKSSDANSSSSSEIAKLTHAVNQQTSVVTTAMTAILKQFQVTPPTASVKTVEEIYVTCGGAYPYYQCLAADGNTFLEFRDNIQGYVSADAVNLNQGNSGYSPLGVANQIRSPVFTQPNVQNNQNRFTQPQVYNRGNKFNQDSSYQALIQQNQVGELKVITTQNGLVLDGPYVPMPPLFINSEEDECVEETLTDSELGEFTIKVPPPLQDKDEIQIHKFWQMFKQLHINITLADALILIPKYQKMLKALLSNKEKLLELANTPLNENCSVVILKKLPKKLRDLGKFLISCGFSKLKCNALADLAKIARDVFVLVGKFTFLAVFVILDYESDPRVPLVLGRPFLRTAHALIDVHGEEMILHLPLPHNINPFSGSTTSSSLDYLLEEFADELALITFPPGNDNLPFDIASDLREIEYSLNHDPNKEMDSILKDSVDEGNLADPNDNLFDTISEIFTDKHAHDYSSPLLYDDFYDDLDELESNYDDAYNDPFDFKEDKIKESKLLIYELDPPRLSDFLPSPEYDSFLFEDFSEVDALTSTNNEEKVFNLGILTHENHFEVTVQATPDKNIKKITISHAS
nr:hypothetical protein [Tanacetum cinerariifolium]